MSTFRFLERTNKFRNPSIMRLKLFASLEFLERSLVLMGKN